MKFKVNPLKAKHLGKEILGDKETEVNFVSNIENAGRDCLTFYTGKDVEFLKNIEAGIILANKRINDKIDNCKASSIVLLENPMYSFTRILSANYKNTFTGNMIHSFLNDKIKVADNSYIEQNVAIGENTEIYPFVSIFNNARIGEYCKIQSFTSIGSIGLAYAKEGKHYERFPHLGGVIIGDYVDIGSNVTVVRGTLQNTVIGNGTKISNNVNIGHNVAIGENCFISAGVVISGSAEIEDNCWIAPGVTILNKVIIKENTQIAIGSVVNKDADKNSVYAGYPARKIANREG
jgi:UDP-3-O-[3-hydroxymyristoyl] glucosamine N-acyltransferase